jgi:lipid-A-disaccharide synthase
MHAAPPARSRRALPAGLSVALEFARALAGVALLPARLADFYFRRASLVEELKFDLAQPSARARAGPSAARAPQRVLRIFVSAAETSGEIHAEHILRALREQLAAAGAPPPEIVGLGGQRLRAAGVRTLFDTVERARMGIGGALAQLPFYLRVLHASARELASCDVALLIDSPALHVPLGRIARRAGARVVHFVAPQYWAWAPWRADGYSSAVDCTLAILPFEPSWYARRDVSVEYVGHPLFDGLPARPPAPEDAQRKTLVLLPGSRRGVIARNLPWMLEVIATLRARRPELEIVLAHSERGLEGLLRDLIDAAGAARWVRLEIGDLHATLGRARAAFAVSGTVLVDLVHQRLPAVVIYKLSGRVAWTVYRPLIVAPFFALPNLVAGHEVLPEFAFVGDGPRDRVAAALEQALDDPRVRRRTQIGLERVAEALGPTGACQRVAATTLELSAEPSP